MLFGLRFGLGSEGFSMNQYHIQGSAQFLRSAARWQKTLLEESSPLFDTLYDWRGAKERSSISGKPLF